MSKAAPLDLNTLRPIVLNLFASWLGVFSSVFLTRRFPSVSLTWRLPSVVRSVARQIKTSVRGLVSNGFSNSFYLICSTLRWCHCTWGLNSDGSGEERERERGREMWERPSHDQNDSAAMWAILRCYWLTTEENTITQRMISTVHSFEKRGSRTWICLISRQGR